MQQMQQAGVAGPVLLLVHVAVTVLTMLNLPLF